MTFNSIADVKERNKETGHYFFDPDSMRFFQSTIGRTLYGGRFFVTSETGPDHVTRWTVRRAHPDGTIATCGEFQRYSTRDAAKKEARRLGEETP